MAVDESLRTDLIRRGSPAVFLGPVYTDSEVRAAIEDAGLVYARPSNFVLEVARSLERGEIVAWYQGRSEAGQRALGARSILGDPRSIEVGERINRIVKKREDWRPLCPTILHEDLNRFVEGGNVSPYMTIAGASTAFARETIPAVVHVDGSLRPQDLMRPQNPLFFDLIRAFRDLTGVGAVINTSLNLGGSPMAETPRDALQIFVSAPIDMLAIDGYLVTKERRAD
jgi:carbamoyltransferase